MLLYFLMILSLNNLHCAFIHTFFFCICTHVNFKSHLQPVQYTSLLLRIYDPAARLLDSWSVDRVFFLFLLSCARGSLRADSMFKTRAPAVGRGKKEKKKTQPSFSEVFSKQCLEKWRQAVSVFVFSLGETKTLTAFGPACLHLAKARPTFS